MGFPERIPLCVLLRTEPNATKVHDFAKSWFCAIHREFAIKQTEFLHQTFHPNLVLFWYPVGEFSTFVGLTSWAKKPRSLDFHRFCYNLPYITHMGYDKIYTFLNCYLVGLVDPDTKVNSLCTSLDSSNASWSFSCKTWVSPRMSSVLKQGSSKESVVRIHLLGFESAKIFLVVSIPQNHLST